MIEIRKSGNEFHAIALPVNVCVFKAFFYESAVQQAHVRDGHVTFQGQRIERPKKMRWWERLGFTYKREAGGRR